MIGHREDFGASSRSPSRRDGNFRCIAERLQTERLELVPLDPAAAAALPGGRDEAAQILSAGLDPGWPGDDLIGILPRQASSEDVRFGIWVIIARESQTVIGDVGFLGPPSDGAVEIGYSIAPEHRRRGYATEAAGELIAWAMRQENIRAVIARCDEDNPASIGTLERLGFGRAGQAEGQLHWRL